MSGWKNTAIKMVLLSFRPVTYVGESAFEMQDYKGNAKLFFTINSMTEQGGEGVITILDVVSGDELFTSAFTFNARLRRFSATKHSGNNTKFSCLLKCCKM